MKKTLCFILENKNLYLDKVLVSFNDTPIFYTCLDQNSNYYLVLCTDLNNFNYNFNYNFKYIFKHNKRTANRS